MYLKEREEDKKAAQPFFAALYNLGTHAFIDVTRGEARYRDGKNKSLNTTYNADIAFGKFWNYYKSSPYTKNTILIVTSDHSAYFEQTHISAFGGGDYQKLFIDRIPFIIFDPSRELPARFDTETSTSLDFAPSILHYLDFENQPNPFLGNSIFEKGRGGLRLAGFSAYNHLNFLSYKGRTYHDKDFSGQEPKFNLVRRLVRYTRKIESENRIWDPKLID